MAKKKERFHIILLGTGFCWKTEELPKTEGRKYTFTAKVKLGEEKTEKRREHVLDAGDAPVLVIKPSKREKKGKRKNEEE